MQSSPEIRSSAVFSCDAFCIPNVDMMHRRITRLIANAPEGGGSHRGVWQRRRHRKPSPGRWSLLSRSPARVRMVIPVIAKLKMDR